MIRSIAIAALVIVAAAVVGDLLLHDAYPPCRLPAEMMSSFDTVAFGLLAEMNKYLISLATILLGGLGAIAMKVHTLARLKDQRTARTGLAVGAVFGIASLYFAFVSHVRLAEAAINHCIEYGPKLQAAQLLQFGALILGVAAALYLALGYTMYEKAPE